VDHKLTYMRNLARVVLTGRNVVIFPAEREQTIVHRTDVPEMWSTFLMHLANPITGAALAKAGVTPADLDEELLDSLLACGHFLVAGESGPLLGERDRCLSNAPSFYLKPDTATCKHLLIGCSGSVVAGLIAPTLLSLSFSGFQEHLDVILTDTAQRFLTRDLLEAYGVRCWTSGFESQDGIRVPHVALARAAEAILVLPATADSLDRIARSACSNLLSLSIAASSAPVLLAPAMNETMWNNPAIQRNLQTLRADGRYILEPSVIFGAADFGHDAPPMYGGHGTLWSGPLSLIHALRSVLEVSQ